MTVMGIIGNTHGVKIAASPNPKAVIRNAGRPPAAVAAGAPELGALAPALLTFTATAPGRISVYPAGTTNATGGAADGSTTTVNDAGLVADVRGELDRTLRVRRKLRHER